MKQLYAMYSLLLCLGSAGFMHGAEEPTAAQELIAAARNNDLEMVKKLIESGRVGVNDTNNWAGSNALEAALEGQDNRRSRSQENWIAEKPLIQYLLDQGATVTEAVLQLALTDPSTNTLRMILESPQVDDALINQTVIKFEQLAARPSTKKLALGRRDRLLKVWLTIKEARRQKLHEALELVEGVQSTGRIIPPIEALIQGYDE